MESGTANLLHMLEDRVRNLLDEGKIDEARHAAETAVEKARTSMSDDLYSEEELSLALEVQGDLFRQLGDYDDAMENYDEALSILSKGRNNEEAVGRVCASQAVIHDLEGRTMEAKSKYERSIACFERMSPPSLLDVADLSNNLAFIYEAEDNFDQAETLLLKALRISHETLGQEHEQTASICNNVGSLYFKADYLEQAREMHMMALETRTKLFGDHNLDTAQSHANLALVFVQSDDMDAAKRHFDRALDAYEGNIKECTAEYETVAANYVDVLNHIGEEKAAGAIEKRAAKALKKAS